MGPLLDLYCRDTVCREVPQPKGERNESWQWALSPHCWPPLPHVPQKTANIGNKESAESAHMCRFLARQCELHSARIAAQWLAASSLFPSLVARGIMYWPFKSISQHMDSLVHHPDPAAKKQIAAWAARLLSCPSQRPSQQLVVVVVLRRKIVREGSSPSEAPLRFHKYVRLAPTESGQHAEIKSFSLFHVLPTNPKASKRNAGAGPSPMLPPARAAATLFTSCS